MPGPISLSTIPLHAVHLTSKIDRIQDTQESTKITDKGKSDLQLNTSCSEMESLFIYYLLKEMRATIPKSDFISGGNAEEIYTSMLDSQLSKEISSRGGIGLSSLLREQLGSDSEGVKNKNIKNE